MFRIAICDDHKVICIQLREMLQRMVVTLPTQIEVETFCRGEDLLAFIQQDHPFDLILLDIELGTTTGVEIGHIIRTQWDDYLSKIIFISASNSYDRQLFTLQPFGFLEKPISEAQLHRYILLALHLDGFGQEVFTYRVKATEYRIPLEQILYFESQLRKIKIVTTQKTEFFNGSLNLVQTQLTKRFFPSHRSYIINFSHIVQITKDSITMSDGATVPISQRYLKQVRAMQIQSAKERRDAQL